MDANEVTKALKIIGDAESDPEFLDWLEVERKELEDDYAEYEASRHSGDDQAETFATWALMRFIEEKQPPAKNFTFELHISGIGKTVEEAWDDAVQGFTQDPGFADPESVTNMEDV